MSTEEVILFLALLAVAAEVAVVGSAGVALAAPRLATAARAREWLAGVVGPDALVLALVVATVATAGSLYLSEVAGFVPCPLCWYQRIAMYPLVPLLAVAVWRRDTGVRATVLVMAGSGALVSTYHVLLERGVVQESAVCDASDPCTLLWVERFGYLTIPTMALSAFALVIVLALLARGPDRPKEDG